MFNKLSEPVLEDKGDGFAKHTINFEKSTKIISVNGGYIAAAMLRTVKAICDDTPANMSIQFIKRVAAGEAKIETEMVRISSSQVALFQVSLFQKGFLAAISQIWTFQECVAPSVHTGSMPVVPHPDEMQSIESIIAKRMPKAPFWEAFEQRHINFLDMGKRKNPTPRSLRWMRHKDGVGEDRFSKASAVLPIVDVLGVPAALNVLGPTSNIVKASTLNLNIQYFDISSIDGWLLGDAYAECINGRLLSFRVQVWSISGSLVCQGIGQMFTGGQAVDQTINDQVEQ